MTKKEFMKWWEEREVRGVREMYKDTKVGKAACMAMTLSEQLQKGQVFWKKHRKYLSFATMEQWLAKVRQAEARREVQP